MLRLTGMSPRYTYIALYALVIVNFISVCFLQTVYHFSMKFDFRRTKFILTFTLRVHEVFTYTSDVLILNNKIFIITFLYIQFSRCIWSFQIKWR